MWEPGLPAIAVCQSYTFAWQTAIAGKPAPTGLIRFWQSGIQALEVRQHALRIRCLPTE